MEMGRTRSESLSLRKDTPPSFQNFHADAVQFNPPAREGGALTALHITRFWAGTAYGFRRICIKSKREKYANILQIKAYDLLR